MCECFAQKLAAALAETSQRSKALRVILLNGETAPELVQAATAPLPRQLTVGRKADSAAADILVNVNPDDERRAFDALTSGTSIEKLVSNNAEKRRFDEAALTRSHANGTPRSQPEEEPAADDKAAAEKPPTDVALLRAVQLHRTLQSRIP